MIRYCYVLHCENSSKQIFPSKFQCNMIALKILTCATRKIVHFYFLVFAKNFLWDTPYALILLLEPLPLLIGGSLFLSLECFGCFQISFLIRNESASFVEVWESVLFFYLRRKFMMVPFSTTTFSGVGI